MAAIHITTLFVFLSAMKAFGYVIPSALTSQFVSATPAWMNLDTLSPSLDPDHNKLGAVASENSICTNIGIDILKAGGNSADSMVATVFCVGVIGMYHSGIGGGGFMLVRSSNGNFEFIDFRETAPAAATQDM